VKAQHTKKFSLTSPANALNNFRETFRLLKK